MEPGETDRAAEDVKTSKPSDLTTGGLWAGIWFMSWPMLLIMILNFMVGLTDVYVAGFIGPEVQAAVGFISQIYFLIIIIANAISVGTLALVARAMGSGNHTRALDVARQSLIFSVGVAVCLTLAGFFLRKEIIFLAGFPAGIRPMAEHFLAIFSLSLGPNYVLIVANAVFRAAGEAKKPLLTMLLVSVFNIAGDFILVLGTSSYAGMGYIGIAVSTALSVTLGMIVNLAMLRSGRWRSLYSDHWHISRETLGKILSIGWPAALLQIAWNAGTILLYNILGRLGYASITALAAITNGLRIEAIIYLPAFALNMAASVLIGQNLGAGNTERAERVGWKIALAGVALVTIMSLAIFLRAARLAAVVTDSSGVLEETARYLRFNMVSEPFMALSAVLGGGLQGAGDTRGTMWIIVVAMWFIRLPLAYLLAIPGGYGATGVWAAMVASMACQGLLTVWRFRQGRWKELKID